MQLTARSTPPGLHPYGREGVSGDDAGPHVHRCLAPQEAPAGLRLRRQGKHTGVRSRALARGAKVSQTVLLQPEVHACWPHCQAPLPLTESACVMGLFGEVYKL